MILPSEIVPITARSFTILIFTATIVKKAKAICGNRAMAGASSAVIDSILASL